MKQHREAFEALCAGLKDPLQKSWLLLSVPEDRAFAGNDGYEDELESCYIWDSTVPNHALPSVGDIVVLWNKRESLGISVIERVSITLSRKARYRCPICSSTKIKRRKLHSPTFKCGDQACRGEFSTPKSETIEVTEYRADYRKKWIPLLGGLSATDCRNLAKQTKSQHSIRGIENSKLTRALERLMVN